MSASREGVEYSTTLTLEYVGAEDLTYTWNCGEEIKSDTKQGYGEIS